MCRRIYRWPLKDVVVRTVAERVESSWFVHLMHKVKRTWSWRFRVSEGGKARVSRCVGRRINMCTVRVRLGFQLGFSVLRFWT